MTNTFIGNQDPEFVTSHDDITRASAELFGYSHQLQMERRSKPADDIVTTLLAADLDGEALSELEFDMFFMILCVAGNETTRNSITHGMLAFFEFPDQWEKFVSDPARYMDSTVDEIVRWASPGDVTFRRQALSDYELGGVKISAGDKVVMWYIAANRDPRAFDEPWRFDIERTPNDHVGFGGGGPSLLSGHQPGQDGDPPDLPGDRPAHARHPPRRPARLPCAPTSSGGVKRLPVAYTTSPSYNTAPLHRPRLRGGRVRHGRLRRQRGAPRHLARRRQRPAPWAAADTWSAQPQAEPHSSARGGPHQPLEDRVAVAGSRASRGATALPSQGRSLDSRASMVPSLLRPVTS